MTLAWPLVAALASVLAFVVAMRWVTRLREDFVAREEWERVAEETRKANEAKLLELSGRFVAMMKDLETVAEEVAKTQARLPAQAGDRSMPLGLRRGG